MLPKNMGENINFFMDKFEKTKYKKGRVNLIQNSLWYDIEKLVYYNLAKFKGEIIIPSICALGALSFTFLKISW